MQKGQPVFRQVYHSYRIQVTVLLFSAPPFSLIVVERGVHRWKHLSPRMDISFLQWPKIISFCFYKDSYKRSLYLFVLKHYSHEKILRDYRFDILYNLHHTSQSTEWIERPLLFLAWSSNSIEVDKNCHEDSYDNSVYKGFLSS